MAPRSCLNFPLTPIRLTISGAADLLTRGAAAMGFHGAPPRAAPAVNISFNRPYAASTDPAASFGVGAGEFLCNVQPVNERISNLKRRMGLQSRSLAEREAIASAIITNTDIIILRHYSIGGAFSSAERMMSIGHGKAGPISSGLFRRTNLFFSGANEIYWQVRSEKDRRGRADRVLAIYKESAGQRDPVLLDQDPSNDHLATTQWRLPPVSRPEDKLIGVMYFMDPVDGDIVVADANHWAFANTGLVNGSKLEGLLGYEVDGLGENTPHGLRVLAASPAKSLLDPTRTVTSNMTAYVAASGAEVFATGSIQWSWGLDDFNAPDLRSSKLSPATVQITGNVLERFGAKRYSSEPLAKRLDFSPVRL